MIAFICTAMVAVESFLYSLLQSMGLIGASYNDISSSFPDNSAQQNQVLYSIANNPTNSNGGFIPIEHRYDDDVANFFYWFIGTSEFGPFAVENWDALMTDLGFAVVQNNVDFAVDNGFDVNANTNSAVVDFEGIKGGFYIYGYAASGTDVSSSDVPFGTIGSADSEWVTAVLRLEYEGVSKYCTRLYLAPAPEFGLDYYRNTIIGNAPFSLLTVDGNLYIRNKYKVQGRITVDTFRSAGFEIPYNNMLSEGAISIGEEYLSFGDVDNPVVSVAYDPATGVTTYTYKDGTTSTTPPAVLGNGVALSPAITQPLTNYIINEGDITNIYNPDAAIPSDSSVPFDFTALGDTIISVFKPTVNFNPEPMFNRFKNKFDPQAYWEKMVKKWNVQPHRPSYPVTINWLGNSVTFDFWDWCDVLLSQQNYMLYRFFVRFFIYCGYVLLIGQLILGLFNIRLTPHVEDSTILGFRG